MLNDEDKQKVKSFVDHLLTIPNIKGEPLLVSEGLILNFVVQNTEQLKVTFKTPQFFPHLEWDEVLQFILSDLMERVTNEALPVFKKFIDTSDFEVFNKLSEGATLPTNFQQEKFNNFIVEIFKNKDVRYHLNCVLNMFKYKIVEKYIVEIFKSRGFLYNELVRVQKTYLEQDEYIIFLKTLLLIRNVAFIRVALGGSETSKINLFDTLSLPKKMKEYMQFQAREIRQQLPNMTEKAIELAIKSNLKSDKTDVEDASSRFLFILTSRFQNYKPIKKVDRGAETPDKSWFGISRKNADHYGFDKRMIDELYMIAGDNNW